MLEASFLSLFEPNNLIWVLANATKVEVNNITGAVVNDSVDCPVR